MKIHVSQFPARDAGKHLSSVLTSYVHDSVLLLVSGGSAFELLDFIDLHSISDRVTLGVLDERFSIDPHINNFSQLRDTSFFKRALEQKVCILDSSVRNSETHQEFVCRIEEMIHTWCANNPKGHIIATMGMGADGHTAGLFPYIYNNSEIDDNRFVYGHTLPIDVNQYTERVTVTYSFLKTYVDHAFVYVSGDSKKEALKSLVAPDGSIEQTPCRVMREMKDVSLYTDIDPSI
jgi:6-phosphogluconolactonase/glucosamine-6-phosphate isomerase/deaminase